MRIFYALTFDEKTLDTIQAIQDSFEELLEKGRRTASSNLHLTLSFLGEQDPRLLPLFKEITYRLPSNPICLQFTHLGRFDKAGGSILWLGMNHNPDIETIQAMLVKELKASGIRFSDTPFNAHVTLFRNVRLAKLPPLSSFWGNAQALHLMHSHQVHSVLTYTPLASNFLLEK
ncbi:MAG: RNA 2',3'-cyclic phosphodiesterase [Spirochaetales bacterium]|nr:RNA 2',3'-cyclic phosphodiesterase [Spirochaetales bacterium]